MFCISGLRMGNRAYYWLNRRKSLHLMPAPFLTNDSDCEEKELSQCYNILMCSSLYLEQIVTSELRSGNGMEVA